MKRVFLILTLAVILLIVGVAGASAQGKGNTPYRLGQAGWHCENVPGLGVHCFPPGAYNASASLSVKYFDTTDPGSNDAAFLGTELLIRADLYAGQPCPQEGSDHYHALDLDGNGSIDYYACHHS